MSSFRVSLSPATSDGPSGRATRLPLCARSDAQPSWVVETPQGADREEMRQGQGVSQIAEGAARKAPSYRQGYNKGLIPQTTTLARLWSRVGHEVGVEPTSTC
jgi:hypothetical protein